MDLLSNQIYNQITDNLDAGIIVLDFDLNIVIHNHWISERSGISPSQLLNNNFIESFDLEKDCRLAIACESALEFGLPSKLSYRFNPAPLALFSDAASRKNNKKLYQRITVNRIKADNGKLLCQLFIEDVTNTVVKEEHLKKLSEENQVARKRAELANESKSQFLATMSHEIRTPMNGILGMLNLLAKTELNSKQQRFTAMANTSARNLLILINDILDFSKIEAQKLELDLIEFDFISLVSELAQSFSVRAQEKNLELILDLSRVEHNRLVGDPGRIRQILNNVVGNAIKFTDVGEVVLKAKVSVETKDVAHINIEVSDTGIGISANDSEKLFDSFTQADASTTRKYGGSGLGLSICKQLCHLMGGSINIDTSRESGSMFKVHLLTKRTIGSISIIDDVNLENMRVLIVDDNEANLFALRSQLVIWGIEVEEANSGQQALDIFYENPEHEFDAAILDMQMPEMDGADLSRHIRDIPSVKNLPLIMLSSISNRGDGRFFADLGFAAYLPKPALPTDLKDVLKLIIQGGTPLESSEPLVTRHTISSMNRQRHKKENILIAEDNFVNQEVIKEILHGDYNLSIVDDGRKVLETLKAAKSEKHYQLILMDCQMPNMDGYEATRAIRAGLESIECREIPIIAMTANVMKGDKEACLEAGMNDYLSKPIDIEELENKLGFWLHPEETKSQAQTSKISSINMDWDKTTALKRISGDDELFKELIELVLADDNIVNSLTSAVEKKNYINLADAAHEITSMVGNIGGVRLQITSQALEIAARNHNDQEISEVWPVWQQQNAVLRQELTSFLGNT